jgi:hypothetical protein
VAIGAMPPVTEGAQVMCFGVSGVVIGATLGNDEGVLECWTAAGIGGCDGAYSGAAKEVNCGGSDDGITLGSGVGAGRSPGREVCWRKMLLSWRS